MDFTKSFSYITEDKEWLAKLGILAAISFAAPFLLGIPYLLVLGYSVAIARNVKKGVEQPLPVWDDWNTLFRDGFNLFVARLVYTLPFLLLLCAFGILPWLGVIGRGGDVSDDVMAGAFFATFGLTGCLSLLFFVAYIFIGPAVVVQYVRHGTLSACLNFGAIFGFIRAQMGNILLITALVIGVGFVFGTVMTVLSIIPILGTLVAMFLNLFFSAAVTAVISHLYGQLAILEG